MTRRDVVSEPAPPTLRYPYTYTLLCGWCDEPTPQWRHTTDPKMHGLISHGICRDCALRIFGEVVDT